MATTVNQDNKKTAEEARELLKQQRKKLDLSQTQIAALAGHTGGGGRTLIHFVENGHRGIPIEKITDFARAYQLSEEALAPLLSMKKRRMTGEIDINDGNSDLDVLPLIKKVVASNREKLTVAELNTLIKGYSALQRSLGDLAPELRDLLLGTLETPKTSR